MGGGFPVADPTLRQLCLQHSQGLCPLGNCTDLESSPDFPVEKLAEPITDDEFAAAIERAKAGVEEAAVSIATQMTLPGSPEYGVLVQEDELEKLQLHGTSAQDKASADTQI